MDDNRSRAKGIAHELEEFVSRHRGCGALKGNADAATLEAYRLWVGCSCGARFERRVTPEVAQADLVFSSLTALAN